jgi:hypothetical protein
MRHAPLIRPMALQCTPRPGFDFGHPPPGCLSTERSLQYRHTRELELQQTVCCRFGSAMPMAALAASTVSFRVLWIWEVKLFQRHLQFW